MDRIKENFRLFLQNYCAQERQALLLKSWDEEHLDGMDYKTYIFETPTSEIVELKDIVPQSYTKSTPLFVLNLQDELAKGNIDDLLVCHLVENGYRVILTKNSFYSKKNLDREFIINGISFWKKNIASQLLCAQYLKENTTLHNVNTIGINGLNSCLIAALLYYEIPCNVVHSINGWIDFNEIADSGQWNQFFTAGYYVGMDRQAVHADATLQFLNPRSLLMELNAQKKILYSTKEENKWEWDLIVKTYHNKQGLLKLLIESV